MTARSPLKNIAASVKQRLLNLSQDEGVDPNLLFTRFAIERFLYRLSCSSHVEQFTLKGAALMLIWFGSRTRFRQQPHEGLLRYSHPITSTAVQ